jgi:16S rRNA G966 N2-methylase RsmD
MDIEIINKIFPKISNNNLLQYDEVGLWSITLPEDANIISNIIYSIIGYTTIFDATAGIGGNTISFSNYFKQVIAIENNITRFNILKNNIDIIKLNNVKIYNDNCFNKLNYNCNGFFFDPPWGGPNYKLEKKLRLTLDNISLYDIIIHIKKQTFNPIFFKLPKNYDLTEFDNFNYRVDNIKKILLVSIL